MGGLLLDGLACLFNSYMQSLLTAMTGCSIENISNKIGPGHPVVQSAETLDQQIAILVNAAILTEDCFACAALMALTGGQISCREQSLMVDGGCFQELVICKSRLQQVVTKIQNRFSKIQEKDFLNRFSSKLNSDVYTNFRWSSEESAAQSRKLKPSAFFEVWNFFLLNPSSICMHFFSKK